MGKNLRQQRRGKGRPVYRSRSHRYIGRLTYPTIKGQHAVEGEIVDIVHSSGKKTPVAIVMVAGKKELMIPAEGMSTGQFIEFTGSSTSVGNVLELANVPEGTRIFNIELRPGDGGKLCRSPGSSALVVTKGSSSTVIEMPSKKRMVIDNRCRVTIGIPAGGGKKEKPFVKAGKMYYAARAVGKYWPLTKGVAKNPVDHPFGGKTKPGSSLTVSRYAPPGSKVGSISARRTGLKKKKS